MARDAELDRLKAAQDLAFQRKQDAYQAMQRAWNRRSSARDTLNQAREAKQQAYAAQEASWQDYQRVRASNGPRIDTLNSQQETAYQNMKSAFEQASNAYARRDGAAARAHADDGHGYKAESQGYVAERRRLVQEIRNARERHEATKPDFQRAKAEFTRVKQAFDQAKADHERTQAEFNRAKEDNERAKQAFHTRLEKVRAERKRKKDDKRAVAERAGVPHQYLDDVWVAKQADGIINIYFGGVGKPNGLGHGHYVMDQYDRVIYRRDPFDPHGAQNFTEPVYWQKVKMSFDRDSGTFQSDNYIGIKGGKSQKSKAHIAVNADGEIVYVRDIGGEVLYDKKNGKGYLPPDLDWSK